LSTESGRAQLQQQLAKWFGQSQRDLPWRKSRDPYAVWVSEIMLQQTTVAAVVPYFQRFLEKFPAIRDLAAAPEEQVLRAWEGLGYYRRARHLWQAAQTLDRENNGEFPRDLEAVLALPGIGRYTAGAILSIAFDARHPILEANTLRLYSRLLGFRGDPRSTSGSRLLWQAATAWLPEHNVGQFNQALMEVGSLICTPREPACSQCPLSALCVTNQHGWQAEIPIPAKKPQIEAVREAAVLVRRQGQILLLKNGPGARWAGLWDFPRFPLPWSEKDVPDSEEELVRALTEGVANRAGVRIGPGERFARFQHGVTRFRITLEGYVAEWLEDDPQRQDPGARQWLSVAGLTTVPLSSPARKLSQLYSDYQSQLRFPE